MDKLLKKLKSLDPEERDQIKQMLSEKTKSDSGTSNEKLGWMYKEGKPEAEDYLLGRRIDKFVDNEKEEKNEAEKNAPGALFSEVMARRADLDMQTKMREDPLYAIRKKEEEARRKLLSNPIKMKQLQKMLDKKKEESESKHKKKKKDKKHKHKREKDSDSDSGDELIKKYLAILDKKKKIGGASSSQERTPSSDEGKDSDSSDDERKHKHKAYGLLIKGEPRPAVKKKSRSRSRSPKRSGSPPDSARRRDVKSSSSSSRRRSRSRSRSRSPRRRRSRSRSRSPMRQRGSGSYRARSPRRDKPSNSKRETKKMDEETMKRLREEMMNDATWRNKQRAANIEKYKDQDEKEKSRNTKTGAKADFLKPIMSKHAEHSSVEDRLKRNRYHIQRTNAAIDKNFTKQ